MITSKYFSESEFLRCNPPCSLQDMDQSTMDLADRLREKAGIPLVINCAYRSKQHDLSKGRSGNSAHVRGKGLDIRCNDSGTRMKILKACYDLGIKRIGVASSFIHIDNDDSLPSNVVWTY